MGEGNCHGMRRRRGEDAGIKQVSHWRHEIHLDMSKVYFNQSCVVKPWSGRGHLSFFPLLASFGSGPAHCVCSRKLNCPTMDFSNGRGRGWTRFPWDVIVQWYQPRWSCACVWITAWSPGCILPFSFLLGMEQVGSDSIKLLVLAA